MSNDLISKRTRNEFREFLVGWTLREIEIEFENAHVECARTYVPEVSGQRRSYVEQYYHTLDFSRPTFLSGAQPALVVRSETSSMAAMRPLPPRTSPMTGSSFWSSRSPW